MRKLAVVIAAAVIAASAGAQPYGYGPGPMGGPGYGMGPGMMGGWGGGGGWGPGMMGGGGPGWGQGALAGLDLSKEQRDKIADIEAEVRAKERALMRSMHDLDWRMGDAWQDGRFDEQAARQAFDAMSAVRRQMFDLWVDSRKQIDAVLTPAQREQLQKRAGRR